MVDESGGREILLISAALASQRRRRAHTYTNAHSRAPENVCRCSVSEVGEDMLVSGFCGQQNNTTTLRGEVARFLGTYGVRR